MNLMGNVSTPTIPRNKLREFRVIPHISQWDLALRSGVKQSRISLIENHLVKPTTRERGKLVATLQRTLEEVFPNYD